MLQIAMDCFAPLGATFGIGLGPDLESIIVPGIVCLLLWAAKWLEFKHANQDLRKYISLRTHI